MQSRFIIFEAGDLPLDRDAIKHLHQLQQSHETISSGDVSGERKIEAERIAGELRNVLNHVNFGTPDSLAVYVTKMEGWVRNWIPSPILRALGRWRGGDWPEAGQ